MEKRISAVVLDTRSHKVDIIRGYFNIAAFYNDFTDQQVFARTLPRPGSGSSGGSVIINAGRSTIKGIEIDASATFFDSVKLDAGYTYLDARIKSLVVPVLPDNSPFLNPVIPAAAQGDRLSLTPRHRLTATYTLPLDERLGRLALGATYTYTSEQAANLAIPAEVGVLPATHLLNLNLDWHSIEGSDFDLGMFATNVTNRIIR